MSEHKTGKYIKYAIGEIVLVMIGILLALQVNNWNEERKERKLEQELLVTLLKTLEQNNDVIKSRMKSISRYQYSGKMFMDIIENNRPYHDSLKFYFHPAFMNTARTRISSLGYESLKNAGLEIMQNDALKEEIVRFFEEDQPGFLVALHWGNIDEADRERFITENFIQGFDQTSNRVIRDPFNPTTILDSNYFKGLIYKIHNQRSYFIDEMERYLENNNQLLEKVKSEIK